jgi:GNAT superfamily N-acetyltransferase
MADPKLSERDSVDAPLAARLAALDRLAFPPRLRYPEAEYLRRGALPGAWIAVAEAEEGALAGFCLAARDAEEPTRLFLDVLTVHPAHRRRGLASLLVRRCLAHALRAGFAAVAVTCEPVSDDGVDLPAFYARLGFGLAQAREDHVLMVARLRA